MQIADPLVHIRVRVPTKCRHIYLTIVFSVIILAVILYPLIMYIIFGWKRRSDDIILSLTPETAKIYFKKFHRKDVSDDKSIYEFEQFYTKWFGRKYLIAPSLLIVVISIAFSYAIVDTGLLDLSLYEKYNQPSNDYIQLPPIALAAMTGALGFVAWDINWRVSRRDLSPLAIMGSVIRLLISIPLGYSLAEILKPDVGPFIAFAFGAFPLQTVQTILQRLANSHLNAQLGASASKDQVTELSSVDRVIADRLADADITTVCQLAYCDPVQTCMRTNLDFAFVSDIVAQALAWIYLGEKLSKLRTIGLRGAVELRMLYVDSTGSDVERRKHAEELIKEAASQVSLSPSKFKNVLEQIGDDPYTVFLEQAWL